MLSLRKKRPSSKSAGSTAAKAGRAAAAAAKAARGKKSKYHTQFIRKGVKYSSSTGKYTFSGKSMTASQMDAFGDYLKGL